jgi:hypothetical protein
VAVFIVAMLLFTAVVGRVAFLQTTGSDALKAAGKAQRTTESVLIARRGTIFARDGGELALSVPSTTSSPTPLVTDPAGVVTVLTNMLPAGGAPEGLPAFDRRRKSLVRRPQVEDDRRCVLALNRGCGFHPRGQADHAER